MKMEDHVVRAADPRAQFLSHGEEIRSVIARVLESGRYILGEEVSSFESEFSAYCGGRYGIGVGSGTEALHIALRACGVGQGDEVITVSHTAVATVAAIELCGAKPVMIDVEDEYFNMHSGMLEDAITPQTKAIVPVHLYGHPAAIADIVEVAHRSGIMVIEDCAQAHGAIYRGRPVGSWGDMACFSFYPTKNLGAIGDGGMIVTSDPELAGRARLLREYGWTGRYVSDIPGWNSRLDEIQAAVLRVKLKYLDDSNTARIALASLYNEGLKDTGLVLPKVGPDAKHVYHLYVIRHPERDKLRAYLESQGVNTLIHYPVPVHLQPAYKERVRCLGDLPSTVNASREVVSLPLYPELVRSDALAVIDAVRSFTGEEHD